MKAILLVRVSTQLQELEEQTLSLKKFAIESGYKDKDLIIIEEKESAIKLEESERKGLNRMKDIISSNKDIETVFVWELSRLTRNPQTAYSLRDYFINNHIQLICYSPSFKLLLPDRSKIDENGSIFFGLYISLAEAEMRNKKERFHRAKIKNARLGRYSGGFVKYGYKVNKIKESGNYLKYEIDEKESELIKYIFDEY